eukprot:gene5450-biopygen13166
MRRKSLTVMLQSSLIGRSDLSPITGGTTLREQNKKVRKTPKSGAADNLAGVGMPAGVDPSGPSGLPAPLACMLVCPRPPESPRSPLVAGLENHQDTGDNMFSGKICCYQTLVYM